ncbi:MAG: hypothetical protein IPL19_05865 [Sandaracinaceae bacterium]|nr:hypothetical protein [Sandaracinaceae bacterium]
MDRFSCGAPWRRLVLGLGLMGALVAGCGSSDGNTMDMGVGDNDVSDMDVDGGPQPPAVRAVFALPRDPATHAFFDLPWPSDVRRNPDGTLDVSEFPQPRENQLVRRYLNAIEADTRGYSINGGTYLRFSASVDTSTLPADAAAAQDADASVFLMNVDADSPNVGTRHAVNVSYRDEATRYWPQHCVAVLPVFGVPLEWDTTYAVVVTRDVKPDAGGDYERDLDFEALLGDDTSDANVVSARAIHAPALTALANAGVAEADILSMAVFTTSAAYNELLAARDFMMDEYELPVADANEWQPNASASTHVELLGRYGPSPIFQQGDLPYDYVEDGGNFVVENGVPVVQDEFDVRFSLTIPPSTVPMPAEGYPIVLYAHGTGGDYRSYARNGVGAMLAEQGIAVMGVDQIHHGERLPGGGDPSIPVFNVLNPLSLRDNARQSALDVVQQARLIDALAVPITVTGRAAPVTFDTSKIYFYGHSQGGVNGPLFLAIDDQAQGGVLSGAGAVFVIAVVDKTEPINIADILTLALGLPGVGMDPLVREHMVYEHPLLALLTTWVDVADTASYAHLIHRAPRPGFAPKSILQTEGVSDPFTPPLTIEALGLAGGFPQVSPYLARIPDHQAHGLPSVAAPVMGNGSGAMHTVGLVQYAGGHFVSTDPPGEALITEFFTSWVEDGVPTIAAGSPAP